MQIGSSFGKGQDPAKAPEKSAKGEPLGSQLLRGKSLQKSQSIKGQLSFDQFIHVSQKGLSSSALLTAETALASLNLQNVEETLTFIEKSNELLKQSRYLHCLRRPTPLGTLHENLHSFAQKRHRVFNMLQQIGTLSGLSETQALRAKALAELTLKNLQAPQFYEPAENVAPILQFYLQTHPELRTGDLTGLVSYLENCYEEDLNQYDAFRQLKQQLQHHSDSAP